MISCYCDNTSDMQVVKNPIVGMLTDVSDIDFGNTLLAIKSYITFLWSHPFKFNAHFMVHEHVFRTLRMQYTLQGYLWNFNC